LLLCINDSGDLRANWYLNDLLPEYASPFISQIYEMLARRQFERYHVARRNRLDTLAVDK
jgi:hypothetical protein